MHADDIEQAEQVTNTVSTAVISFWYFLKASTNKDAVTMRLTVTF